MIVEHKREKKESRNGSPSLFKEKEMLSSIVILIGLLTAVVIAHYIRIWAEKRDKDVPRS
jgi:D-alanyl-lipoteichoic acid acyltransferase DltB (MBOAT superfamily)